MSAGGLEVATAFLNAMPADSGMGFVIVQHLDPTRQSMLADILSRETTMPVVQIEDGMRVEPNRVHIIIPAKTLLIQQMIERIFRGTVLYDYRPDGLMCRMVIPIAGLEETQPENSAPFQA